LLVMLLLLPGGSFLHAQHKASYMPRARLLLLLLLVVVLTTGSCIQDIKRHSHGVLAAISHQRFEGFDSSSVLALAQTESHVMPEQV
jgi:hypothetical protein